MIIKLFFALLFLSLPLLAGPSDSNTEVSPKVYILDDFEDSNMNSNPEWWGFGGLQLSIVNNSLDDKITNPFLEQYSIRFTGFADAWYVGGTGTYMTIDGSRYTAMKAVIKGNGKDSGTVLIELFDDDNGNKIVERDPRNPTRIMYDDKVIYNLKIDWDGWRVVIIPLDQFVDDNPSVGDDIWNPSKTGNSGGFVQMQLLGISSSAKGLIQFDIDSIKFY